MTLYINTIKNNSTEIEIGLRDKAGKWIVKKSVKARYQQAERLLPLIEKVLASASVKFNKDVLKKKKYEVRSKKLEIFNLIDSIKVVNRGGTFTSLRIGVATANALGYALGVPVFGVGENGKIADAVKKKLKVTLPAGRQESEKLKVFNIVAPEYDKEPNITIRNT